MLGNTEIRRVEFLARPFGMNWGRLVLLSAGFLLLVLALIG